MNVVCKKCKTPKIRGKACKACKKAYNKAYYLSHKDEAKKQAREWKRNNPKKVRSSGKKYRQENEEKERLRHQVYYRNNKEKAQKYYLENKDRIRKYKNEWVKSRYKQDPCFKLRMIISRNVRLFLEKGKGNRSILDYLPYTMSELKKHLESQFEPWMNWENHGKYDISTWDDANSSTWTWHIDHIVPQSKLLYDSMAHPNFSKCWALGNLRPLSAKQNMIDGARMAS